MLSARLFIILFAKLIMFFNYLLLFFDNKGRYIFQLCKSFAEKLFFSTLLPNVILWCSDYFAISNYLTRPKIGFSLFADANIYTFCYFAKHNTIFPILFFYADNSFYQNYPYTLIYATPIPLPHN